MLNILKERPKLLPALKQGDFKKARRELDAGKAVIAHEPQIWQDLAVGIDEIGYDRFEPDPDKTIEHMRNQHAEKKGLEKLVYELLHRGLSTKVVLILFFTDPKCEDEIDPTHSHLFSLEEDHPLKKAVVEVAPEMWRHSIRYNDKITKRNLDRFAPSKDNWELIVQEHRTRFLHKKTSYKSFISKVDEVIERLNEEDLQDHKENYVQALLAFMLEQHPPVVDPSDEIFTPLRDAMKRYEEHTRHPSYDVEEILRIDRYRNSEISRCPRYGENDEKLLPKRYQDIIEVIRGRETLAEKLTSLGEDIKGNEDSKDLSKLLPESAELLKTIGINPWIVLEGVCSTEPNENYPTEEDVPPSLRTAIELTVKKILEEESDKSTQDYNHPDQVYEVHLDERFAEKILNLRAAAEKTDSLGIFRIAREAMEDGLGLDYGDLKFVMDRDELNIDLQALTDHWPEGGDLQSGNLDPSLPTDWKFRRGPNP
jgi:CRISPR/Cas system-associated exonuclease Cas4 (RecB family)